jgi:hypothetical protein
MRESYHSEIRSVKNALEEKKVADYRAIDWRENLTLQV